MPFRVGSRLSEINEASAITCGEEEKPDTRPYTYGCNLFGVSLRSVSVVALKALAVLMIGQIRQVAMMIPLITKGFVVPATGSKT